VLGLQVAALASLLGDSPKAEVFWVVGALVGGDARCFLHVVVVSGSGSWHDALGAHSRSRERCIARYSFQKTNEHQVLEWLWCCCS
jgi:hypothetical protein